MSSKEADLAKLQELSLLHKVCSELDNHLRINDPEMGEFVIHLASESQTLPGFKTALKELDEGFPPELASRLWTLIQTMTPNKKSNGSSSSTTGNSGGNAGNGSSNDSSTSSSSIGKSSIDPKLRAAFPGLALPDKTGPAKNDTLSAPGLDFDDTPSTSTSTSTSTTNVVPGSSISSSSSSTPGPRRSRFDKGAPSIGTVPDSEPRMGKVYPGTVARIEAYGVFVRINEGSVRGAPQGLVHVSAMVSGKRVEHPKDVVDKGQQVWVKVKDINARKLSLSMKDVDQGNGTDLKPGLGGDGYDPDVSNPPAPVASSSNMVPLGGSASAPLSADLGVNAAAAAAAGLPPIGPSGGRMRKRLTSQERREEQLMRAAGVLSVEEMAEYDHEGQKGVLWQDTGEDDEGVDVEIVQLEPTFLSGQTSRAVDLSPVRVAQQPDGSMVRAAEASLANAKERRELKQAQQADVLESVPKDIARPWEDPMPAPGERQIATQLSSLAAASTMEEPEWRQATQGPSQTLGKRVEGSIKEQREGLPIFGLRSALLKAIQDHQVLVVIGETGSGKTTQMTQYLVEAGYHLRGKIGCTQPRRVAAMSVAKRVSEEYGCVLGKEVGYSIRFEDETGPETLIKYMTDGMLLREALLDPNLKNYSVIILDEAHERTIPTDVLFGLLKATMERRKDLKVIVTSATLDAEKFSKYFWECPIFRIPGRMHPVEILYSKTPESDYLFTALKTVMTIHVNEPPGDILVFLTGQEEIENACEILYERKKALGSTVPELIILPVYSALPSEIQTRIFDPAPPGARKVVIATNIAETSLTIDGIYYVVDPGFVKVNMYNPKVGMDSLVVVPISAAAARQRSGRAGRTGPGKCFRLYTEAAFKNEMLPTTPPEIQRTNLAMTVLTLKAMGINDLLGFDFMDPPPVQALVTALQQLYNLSALDDEGLLTAVGRKMAEFPLEPMLSKMLIASVQAGCSDEILTIVAMLSVGNVFYRPRDKQALADQRRAKFQQPEGDHLTLLAVYEGWKQAKFSNSWSYENFLHARSMKRAQDIRNQLIGIMDRYRLDVVSAGRNYDRIRKAICSGFFAHAAKKDPQEGWKTLIEGQTVYVHPSSALWNKGPEWVVYHTLVMTSKEYMREVTVIEPSWLIDVAPQFFRKANGEKMSKRKRQEKVEPLFDRFAGSQDEWRLSKRRR